jgi:hypothetical protein
VIYSARAESNAALLPDIQIAPAGARLVFLPHRATYLTPFPGSQFPVRRSMRGYSP